jgi:type II secretory pathway pseudopilin PulG
MKLVLRVLLLGVIVVLGFTAVFPEWFDFKDQVVAEKRQEQSSAQQEAQDQRARQRHQEDEKALRALEPQAATLAERIWVAVDSGNYGAPFEDASARLQSQLSSASATELQAIWEAVGPQLSADAARSKPGYDTQIPQRVYLLSGMKTLIAESIRWSDNALLKRTLELKLEDGQLKVDALLVEIFLYPDNAGAVPPAMRKPHIFR